MNKISVLFSLTLSLPTILAGCASFPNFNRQAATPVVIPPSPRGDRSAEISANSIERNDTLKRSIEQQLAEALNSRQQKAAPPEQTEPADQGSYLVRRGDTLSLIAQAFVVTTRQLQYRNNIENRDQLQVGTYLTIPNRDFKVPRNLNDNNGSDFIWPVRKPDISSDFGARAGQHAGIDFRAPRDTEILSAADGVILFSGTKKGYGRTIVIQHTDKIRTLYAHNHKNLVRKGQRVKKGDVIATVGKSGNATGYHLHFEYIRDGQKLNPHLYVYQDDTPDNGEVAFNP